MALFEHFPYTNFHDLNQDWILKEFKNLKSKIDEVNAALEKLDEYTQAFNNLTALYNQLEADFISFKQEVNNDFAAGMNQLNTRFNELSIQLNGQYASFTAGVNNIIAALTDKVNDLDTALQQVISDLENTIILFNPLTGEENTLQQIIYYLASLHMTDALTASEYDALDMSATYYDAKDLTAYQYDSSGKTLLP